MAKKVISFGLNTKDINKAIKELEQYKIEFQKKVDTYRKRIAEEIAVNASLNFGSSQMEDIIGTIVGGELVLGSRPRTPDVTVNVSERGNISVVVANGEDAVWCEFGAGVYHNGSAGSSPNPYGKDLGFTIGSYGKGHGKQQKWGYYDENGEVVITRGTPASMPMYNAVQEVMRKAIDIAREVFG
jgi:hypothetical protein